MPFQNVPPQSVEWTKMARQIFGKEACLSYFFESGSGDNAPMEPVIRVSESSQNVYGEFGTNEVQWSDEFSWIATPTPIELGWLLSDYSAIWKIDVFNKLSRLYIWIEDDEHPVGFWKLLFTGCYIT